MLKIKNKKNRYTTVIPSFTMKMWCIRGYTLHGRVNMMKQNARTCRTISVQKEAAVTKINFLRSTNFIILHVALKFYKLQFDNKISFSCLEFINF